jgi:hypothetical protein
MRSGLSRGQAMAVTQPACPLKSPPQHKRLSHNADALLPHRLFSFRFSSPSLSGEAWAKSKRLYLNSPPPPPPPSLPCRGSNACASQATTTSEEDCFGRREGLIPQTLNPSRTRLRALKLLGDFGVGLGFRVWLLTELLCVSWPSFQANVKWDHYDKSSNYLKSIQSL